MSRFYCPKCNARLDKQPDFDPNAEEIICAKCGHAYFGTIPDEPVKEASEDVEYVSFDQNTESGYIYTCKQCGAVLNEQDSFDPAKEAVFCTNCGCYNELTKAELMPAGTTYDAGGETAGEYTEPEEEEEEKKGFFRKKSRKGTDDGGKKKKWKLYLILAAILVVIVAGLLIYNHARKLIKVGISSEEAKGSNYEKVVTVLVKSGFKNIKTEALGDLKGTALSDQDLIETVVIDGDLEFDADSKYTYDSAVKISYHSVKMVSAPMASKKAIGQDYQKVVEQFQNAGFEEVTAKPEYDLVVGWFSKENTVETIHIGEKEKFKENEEFKYNDPVVITYHAFPDKKPKTKK